MESPVHLQAAVDAHADGRFWKVNKTLGAQKSVISFETLAFSLSLSWETTYYSNDKKILKFIESSLC